MLKLNHKKMDVWQKIIQLVKMTYGLTSMLPTDERFGLVSQLNRASVSILSNISEGASRSSRVERKRFYEIARSSLVEVDTQLEILLELDLLQNGLVKDMEEQVNKVFAMLSNLIKSTIIQ